MKTSQIRLVYRKEILDTLRDRRTLMSMIVVPMLVIPGLMFGLGRFTVRLVEKAAGERATVMIVGGENAPTLSQSIRSHMLLEVVEPAPDFKERIEAKELRAAIEFPADFEARVRRGDDRDLVVRTYYHEGEIRSEFAVRTLEQLLQEFRDEIVAARLAARDLSPDLLEPFETEDENVASPAAVSGSTLGGMIPYIIILLTLTGAMYPAIDVTAGEKERGTIETILASPVSRSSLAVGKFLTVLTVACATAVLALLSLGISSKLFAGSQTGEIAAEAKLSLALEPTSVVAMLAMVLPVAVMFSAVLLAIALLAKSYKEAQSYLSPLMIVVILPAIAAMLPGIEMNLRLALIPILNVSLISKELLTGNYEWHWIGLIFASSCVYAGVALFVASQVFRRESVLFRT